MNYLGALRRGGTVLENPIEIKEEVIRLFEDLYKGKDFVRPKLDGVFFPIISTDVYNWLEREFEEGELALALEECGRDKAPGQDGFNFTFIKAAWGFLKKDFADMLSKFHRSGKINREINATFLSLIPKVSNPVELRDYRS